MGTPIDRKEKINELKRSNANNYIAEVFLEELQFILKEDLLESLMIICHGMNPRVHSKDILSASLRYFSTPNSYKEVVALHLARNSMYHQLPELLFHPLVISTPGMSNKEIVDAIRTNKKREKEMISFFIPFDTAFFKERVKIIDRDLNFFSNPAMRENLDNLVETMLGIPLDISNHQKYKLFLFLCHSDEYMENLTAIERMFSVVLDIEVRLRYIPHVITVSQYSPINEGILGENLGLNGVVECEGDDLEATIVFGQPENSDDYKGESRIDTIVTEILSFFILSFREIHIKHLIQGHTDCILGENRLGYDMNL